MNKLSQQIIDRYQKGFPLSPTPYKVMADELNASEQEIIDCIKSLQQTDVVSRVGPVFNHKKAGASTLAAIAVPEHLLSDVAEVVNEFKEVNHNYAREHHYNLWFVVTTSNNKHLEQTLWAIRKKTGYPILNLPMEKSYHIDLGFKLNWN